MAPTFPTSYPRTVAGLRAALEPIDVADFAGVAGQLTTLARQLPGSWARTGGRIPGPAAQLARDLAVVIGQLPAAVVALRSLTSTTIPPATEPLFVPDAADVHIVRNAGTGTPATDPDQVIVPWWPALPAAALETGFTALTDVTVDQLEIRNCRCDHHGGHVDRWAGSPVDDLIGYARTFALVRSRDAGYHEFARRMRGGGRTSQARPRQTARAIAGAYRDLVTQLEPLGDQLAAGVAAYIEATWSLLTALTDQTEGEFTMPVLASTAAVASLASRIRDAITAGHGGRLTVSESEVAFAWAPGQARTLLTYLSTGTVTGRHTTVVTARNAATVVGPVAEGAPKPTVVDFSSDEVDLVKYAGMALLTTESANFVSNIEAAVSSVLVSQIVRAIEKDAVTALTAGAGVAITAAADITAGVLSAIAGIRENGGAPTVVGLAAADWLEIMTATGGSGYLNFSAETGPAGTWLGLAPVILPGQTAGSAIVADGSAVSVLEPAGGPLCVVDVYSQISNNKIQIAVEEWATTQVTSPGGVATVAVGP